MTESQFTSRRDAREAERTGRVTPSVPAAEVIANAEPTSTVTDLGGFNFPPYFRHIFMAESAF